MPDLAIAKLGVPASENYREKGDWVVVHVELRVRFV
jgi:hypothetical protein